MCFNVINKHCVSTQQFSLIKIICYKPTPKLLFSPFNFDYKSLYNLLKVQNSSDSIGPPNSTIAVTEVKSREHNHETSSQKSFDGQKIEADHVDLSKVTSSHDSGEDSQNISFSDEDIIIDCENPSENPEATSAEYYEVTRACL